MSNQTLSDPVGPAPDPALVAAARPDLAIGLAQSEYMDVLRGSAAQLVLIQHALTYALPGRGYDGYNIGALGVQMFFLLSGFLITQTVTSRIRRGRFTFAEFMISRFCRIYTPYVPAIALVAILDWYSQRSPAYEYAADYNIGTGIANLLMLQDFPLFQILRRLHVPDQPWFVKTFGSGRQFWTVSIEWWIYVTVGLLAAIGVARGRTPRAMLAVLALAAIEPIYNLVGGPGDSLTFTWLAGAAASLLLNWLATGRPDLIPGRFTLAGLWIGLAALAGTRLFFTHGRVYEPILTLLLAGLIFVPLLHYRSVSGHTVFRRLGLHRLSFHSYSLYLSHGSIVVFMATQAPEMIVGWRGMVTIMLVANLLAIPFAVAFELPHRGLRRLMLRAVARQRG